MRAIEPVTGESPNRIMPQPCPQCGTKLVSVRTLEPSERDNRRLRAVVCNECGFGGAEKALATEAVVAWNRGEWK